MQELYNPQRCGLRLQFWWNSSFFQAGFQQNKNLIFDFKLHYNPPSPSLYATILASFFLPFPFYFAKNPSLSELSKPRCGTADAESPRYQHSP